MTTNPYQSPVDAVEPPKPGDTHERAPVLAYLIVAFWATLFSWFTPYLAVPAAMLFTPALARTKRLLLAQRESQPAALKYACQFVVSTFAVIPVAIGSSIAFGCVFAPAAWLTYAILSRINSETDRIQYIGGIAVVGAGILVGTWLALLSGWRLLRRWHFLSIDVLRAERKAAAGNRQRPSDSL